MTLKVIDVLTVVNYALNSAIRYLLGVILSASNLKRAFWFLVVQARR